jgi:hypothetical protein
MNHLFYYSTAIYRSFVLLLDEAEECIKKGETPIFLTCNGTLEPYCFTNVTGNKWTCRMCRMMRQMGMKALSQSVTPYFIQDLLSDAEIQRTIELKFDYHSAQDVYNIKYKNVDIGYGAMSHYCACTRNFSPTITSELRKTIDSFLRTSIFLTDAIENLTKKYDITSISLFNGRTFDTRPVLRKGIELGITTRTFDLVNFRPRKECFINSIPHNVEMQSQFIRKQWEDAVAKDKERAFEIGHRFFKNRRSGIPAGDRVYITQQSAGKLPEKWDESKRNVVFFNSSEDEFAGIDAEWDSYKYCKSQMDGILKVLDLIKDEQDKFQLYVRVHPNLAGVTLPYHTDLYKLEANYPCLTVISPTSPISTYALIDHADKIIVYGSTVGIEAVYWGKPVIQIGPSYYRNLNVCYIPENDTHFKELLTRDLSPIEHGQEAALMHAYSVIGDIGLPFYHFDFLNFWPDLILAKVIRSSKMRMKVLNWLRPITLWLVSIIQRLCYLIEKRQMEGRKRS